MKPDQETFVEMVVREMSLRGQLVPVRLVLLADVISAAEADRMGLVNYVVPADELDAKVDELAIKAANGPPRSIAMSKAMLNKSFSVSLPEALDQEGTSQTVNFYLDDVREAMQAFVDKRDPKFTGW